MLRLTRTIVYFVSRRKCFWRYGKSLRRGFARILDTHLLCSCLIESGGLPGATWKSSSRFSVPSKVRWASGSDLEALFVEHGRDARATQANTTQANATQASATSANATAPDGILCLPPDGARKKPTARSFDRKSVELRMTSFTTLCWANRDSKTACFAGGLSDPLERHFQLD